MTVTTENPSFALHPIFKIGKFHPDFAGQRCFASRTSLKDESGLKLQELGGP